MKDLIKIENICNLSRLPVSHSRNPICQTARIILESNYKDFEGATGFLLDYYRDLKFSCLNSIYNTSIPALDGFKYHNYFLPWYHTKPVTSFRDDAFITRIEEGKIIEKVHKIKNLLSSIERIGYNPDMFVDRKLGHISGYRLISKSGKARFYVVSGNHRAACLHVLGFKKIPVIFEKTVYFKDRDRCNFGWCEMPSSILEKDCKDWPAVMSGFLSQEESVKIFEKYMVQV